MHYYILSARGVLLMGTKCPPSRAALKSVAASGVLNKNFVIIKILAGFACSRYADCEHFLSALGPSALDTWKNYP